MSRQAVYKSHFGSKAELLLALVRYMHVAENLDELTRPVVEARSGLAMLEAAITATVLIEARVHDLGVVLSAAAVSDPDAAAAWQDRMEVKRGALRAALTRVAAEGRLSSTWAVEEAVDFLSALLSVEAHHQLVVEHGWTPEALIGRIWEVCEHNILTRPKRQAPKRAARGRTR